MSESAQNITIRIGSDPRSRPEFDAIREEINKISHPAQPEVNWGLIESRALTLFRTHGIDLQTAVYYTLARTHKQGLVGFTEGCELLAKMVVHHWDALWPGLPQARAEILEWFTSRAGNIVRQYHFSRNDMRQIYRAERALQLLCDKLQQLQLKRVPRIENLLCLMQEAAERIENTENAAPSMQQTPIHLTIHEPEISLNTSAPQKNHSECDLRPECEAQPLLMASPARRLPLLWGFAAGVLFSLILATAAYFAWIKPERQALKVLASTPEGAALLWLNQPDITTYGEQLDRLDNLSPLTGLQTADALVATARERWPADAKQQAESERRSQRLQNRAAVSESENSYQQLRQQLRALSDTLIEREQSHSGLTISYLKTVVYQMQDALSRDVPLEELIRQYSEAVQQQPVSPVLVKQTEERLNALLSRYHQSTVRAGEPR